MLNWSKHRHIRLDESTTQLTDQLLEDVATVERIVFYKLRLSESDVSRVASALKQNPNVVDFFCRIEENATAQALFSSLLSEGDFSGWKALSELSGLFDARSLTLLLPKVPKLEKLTLFDFGDVGPDVLPLAQQLLNMSSLTALNLRGNNRGDTTLLRSICQIRSLVTLEVHNYVLNDERCAAIAEGLHGALAQSLKALTVAFNLVPASGAMLIVDAAPPMLTTLNLNINPLRDEGILYIAKFLRTNKTLTHLEVARTYHSYNALLALTDVLCTENTTLSYLCVAWDELNIDGCRLYERLMLNSRLKVLDLKFQRFDDTTLSEMIPVFERNQNVTGLHVGWNESNPNKISQELHKRFFFALERNCFYTSLSINGGFNETKAWRTELFQLVNRNVFIRMTIRKIIMVSCRSFQPIYPTKSNVLSSRSFC